MIADQENAESKNKLEANDGERKIIKARRKFSQLSEEVGKEESTRDADIAPRGKFVLKGSLGAPTTA